MMLNSVFKVTDVEDMYLLTTGNWETVSEFK